MSYFVEPFIESTEADFEFPLPVKELVEREEDQDGKTETEVGREVRSLGELSVPLSAAWIREQLADGKLPSVGIKNGEEGPPWSAFEGRGSLRWRTKVRLGVISRGSSTSPMNANDSSNIADSQGNVSTIALHPKTMDNGSMVAARQKLHE